MKLFMSPTSPYVRKVLVVAHEVGVIDDLEMVPMGITPIAPDANLNANNALGKVPALVTDQGQALFDSRVIAEYLDSRHAGLKMFPADGESRWQALRQQALGDGILDAAILARYEGFLRPEDLRWSAWSEGQMGKINRGLDAAEADGASLGRPLDIGVIALACALGYMDFRYADMGWRDGRPKLTAFFDEFSKRASMQATEPPEG